MASSYDLGFSLSDSLVRPVDRFVCRADVEKPSDSWHPASRKSPGCCWAICRKSLLHSSRKAFFRVLSPGDVAKHSHMLAGQEVRLRRVFNNDRLAISSQNPAFRRCSFFVLQKSIPTVSENLLSPRKNFTIGRLTSTLRSVPNKVSAAGLASTQIPWSSIIKMPSSVLSKTALVFPLRGIQPRFAVFALFPFCQN